MTICLAICSCLSWFKQPGSCCKLSWNGVFCINVPVPFYFGASYFQQDLQKTRGLPCICYAFRHAVLGFDAGEIASLTDTQKADEPGEAYLQGLAKPLCWLIGQERTLCISGCSGRGEHFNGEDSQTPRSWAVSVPLVEIFVSTAISSCR